jgi:hypothetical protein
MFASRRLKYRDYSAPGHYFVTVCTDFKQYTFGKVADKKVELSPLGRIVEAAWLTLSSRIFGIQLHATRRDAKSYSRNCRDLAAKTIAADGELGAENVAKPRHGRLLFVPLRRTSRDERELN